MATTLELTSNTKTGLENILESAQLAFGNAVDISAAPVAAPANKPGL